MAVIRVERTKDYTIMANHHLRNKELSMKAKGLMSVLLSLPDEWHYSISGLTQICKEGADAIRDAIRELEKCGYVTRSRVRNKKGQLIDTEYIIREKPDAVVPTEDEPAQREPAQEKPLQEKPMKENPALDLPALGNPTQLNTDTANTQESTPYPKRKEKSITKGENQPIHRGKVKCDDLPPVDINFEMQLMRDQIGYDVLVDEYGWKRMDKIVSLLVEMKLSTEKWMMIEGEFKPIELVRDRLKQLNSLHIQYVFDCLSSAPRRIHNIKNYLRSMFFNAPATCDEYYEHKANCEPYPYDLEV